MSTCLRKLCMAWRSCVMSASRLLDGSLARSSDSRHWLDAKVDAGRAGVDVTALGGGGGAQRGGGKGVIGGGGRCVNVVCACAWPLGLMRGP